MTRYQKEIGQHRKDAASVKSTVRVLVSGRGEVKGLGKDAYLSRISDGILATYVAERRVGVANATVNGDLRHLRAVINRARDFWEYQTPKINWTKLFLKERIRQRILSYDEDEHLMSALRSETHAIVRFCLLSGVRISNAVRLK